MDSKIIRQIRIDPVVPSQSVLISTARSKRPKTDDSLPERDMRDHVASCPFCPGNEELTPPSIFRSPESGKWDIRIVENLYPLLDDDPPQAQMPFGIQQAIEGYGHHEVIIDHSNHGISIQQFTEKHLAMLFRVYQERMNYLYNADPRIKYVLVFKNFGRAAGGSMPHTHSQLIAMPIVPHNLYDEIECSRVFFEKTESCIFCALIQEKIPLETTTYDRRLGKAHGNYSTDKYVIERGRQFVAIKPFASRYEWEVHILPIQHQSDFLDLSNGAMDDLARIFKRTMMRLQAVIGEFHYNYFLHSLPVQHKNSHLSRSFHWHFEICPRTSVASGFELGSGLFVNTVSPEDAVLALKQVILTE